MATATTNNQSLPLLGRDTSFLGDTARFVGKILPNTVQAIYDPTKVDIDDLGRIFDKAVNKLYPTAPKIVQKLAIFDPRLRTFINNMIAMDLDSDRYIDPILQKADKITLNHLEPLMDRNGLYGSAHDIATRMKDLAERVEDQGTDDQTQNEYSALMHDLHAARLQHFNDITTLSREIENTLADIDKIKLPKSAKSLKLERVKALRKHLLRIQNQGVALFQHLEKSQQDLSSLANAPRDSKDFASRLAKIAKDLDSQAEQNRLMGNELADKSFTRQNRVVRLRRDGEIIGTRAAKYEDFRKLKQGIDTLFVPDAPQKLGIIEPSTLEHNAENCFILTVEYANNNASKEDGSHIPLSERGEKYGTDLAEHVAKMYSLGLAEDALLAIKMLKLQEGIDSIQTFPASFKDDVKKQIARFYGTDISKIDADAHASGFLKSAGELSSDRDHSPLASGPRSTNKQVVEMIKEYLYGRMYPPSEQFLATPLTQKAVHHPLIKARSKGISYILGGEVVPLNRAAKKNNPLETELKLMTQYRWWWKKPETKDAEGNEIKGQNAYQRAPFWVKTPIRAVMLSSVPAAVILYTGGMAAPAFVMWPVVVTGAASGLNYGGRILKAAWALPIVNRPLKFAAKWTTIGAATAGAIYVAAPFAPAALALGAQAAVAYPIVSAALAAPVATSIAMGAHNTVKSFRAKAALPDTFADYRTANKIEDDPLNMRDDHGAFIAPEPDAPAPVVLEITTPEAIAEEARTQEAQARQEELNQSHEMMREFIEAQQEQINTQNTHIAELRATIAEQSQLIASSLTSAVDSVKDMLRTGGNLNDGLQPAT